MARFPDDETFRIKHEVDLVALIRESGIELTRMGRDWVGRCELHGDGKDTRPSLHVTAERGLWNCFGCAKGGDAFTWVMLREGVSFPDAKRWLLERLGGRLAAPAPRVAPLERVGLVGDARVEAVVKSAAAVWQRTLWESRPAQRYLEGRGLLERSMLERFGVGYSDGLLAKAPPDARGTLERTGILGRSGLEHLRGCITVPLFDEEMRIVQVYGRRLEVRHDIRHLNLPGPRRGVWNWPALRPWPEAILCEAILDGMTFARWGFPNVVACQGTEAFGQEHEVAFRRHAVRRVLIAFDRDEAGDRGAAKVAGKLGAAGIACYRVVFPHGMDANEYALKVTPAAKALGVALASATWIGPGKAPSHAMAMAAGKGVCA